MPRRVSRTAAIAAGLLIVLVPTVFGLFPEWTRWSLAARLAVLLLWLVAATVVVFGGVQQSDRIEDLLQPGRRRRDKAREAAGRQIIRALLVPESTGLPPDCEFSVFLPDTGHGLLVPFYASTTSPTEAWEIGQGAVGRAFDTSSLIRVEGEAISDATYGLTPEQQARYGDLHAVVAVPILNAQVIAVGVLGASTTTPASPLLGAEAGERLQELAAVIARVLVDILRVSRD